MNDEIRQCPYCRPTSGGNHQIDCPLAATSTQFLTKTYPDKQRQEQTFKERIFKLESEIARKEKNIRQYRQRIKEHLAEITRLREENAELKALINGLLALAKDMMPICPDKALKMIMTTIDKGKELQAECRQNMLNALADDMEIWATESQNLLSIQNDLVQQFIRNWRPK